MHLSRIVLAHCVLGTAALAQNYTAHPIDNLNSSTSNLAPFGALDTSIDEARSQFLFLAPFVPTTGGVITGLELVPAIAGTLPYERFEIWMDHTTNTTLSTTFAANLTNPMMVFSRSPGTIPWIAGSWNVITFDLPFPYDGTRNLVMEVRKKLDRPNNPTLPTTAHRVLVYPRRVDLPPPVWDVGAYGSGKVDSTTATTVYTTQMIMRLRWGATKTLTIDSTRDMSGNPNRSYFHLGAAVTVTAQGTPGETFVHLYDGVLNTSGMPVAPINGEYWLTRFFILSAAPIDAGGRGSVTLTIPNDLGLVGIRVLFQSVIIGATLSFTNVVDGPIAVY